MTTEEKEGYIIYQDRLCKIAGINKKELLELLERKDIYSKYWQSAFTWTQAQRDEFADWAKKFFNKERFAKLKSFFFSENALEAYKDNFDQLVDIWADSAGWRMEDTEIRPNKPEYLYVNAPKWMPVLWTIEEFNTCTINDLSRFWINTKYAIEEKDELGIIVYAKEISDAVLKKLNLSKDRDVFTFKEVGMEFMPIPNDNPRVNWIRTHLKQFFFKDNITDAIKEELNVNWKDEN